jgi:hypothetical protein
MRILPSFSTFYKMLFMNKLEFSSLIDCLVWISESIGEVRFTIRFSYFQFIVFSMGKRCYYIKSVIRERIMLLSKVNK